MESRSTEPENSYITFSILDEEVLRIEEEGWYVRGRSAGPDEVMAALREFVEYVQEEDPRFKDLEVSFEDDDGENCFDSWSVPKDTERVRLMSDGRVFMNHEEVGKDQEMVHVLMAYLRLHWSDE